MKRPSNYLTLALMSTSMILLVALQAFWLRNSYEKAYMDLRGEATHYFRDAVFAIRDSAILRNIEALPSDSAGGPRGFIFTERADSQVSIHRRKHAATEGQVQVYMSSRPGSDTAKLLLRSVASHLHEGKLKGNSRFVIRFNNDTLSTDSIRAQFGRALTAAHKAVPFDVIQADGLPFSGVRMSKGRRQIFVGETEEAGHHRSMVESKLQTDWIRIEPGMRYAAVLSEIRPLLLKEKAPQILFGCFLTILTLISFAVMYRNIRSQQRLMAIKNDFISNITHELKTPIATVSVALEALKNFRGMDNPKLTAEYLDIAQLELGRLSILTDKVLTTALFDERGMKFDFESVDMDQVISTILNSMKLVLEKQHAQVSIQKSGNDFVVEGSSLHLTNVVYNLLDNAMKYSPGGPIITLAMEADGDKVIFTVTDKGLGIPTAYQSRIFEKFFRMPTGDVHNIKGHGLGLHYVHQVVRSHGGTITVKSEPGHGSAFTVMLPKHH